MGELIPSGTTVDQMHKAQAEAQPALKPRPVAYAGPVYRTVIKNNRRSGVMVLNDRGGNWIPLVPGEEREILSWSESTLYAPFSKVSYERASKRDHNLTEEENDDKYGRVSTSKRSGFKAPTINSQYQIILNNIDGAPLEVLQVDSDYVEAMKGIPRVAPISLADPRVGYREVRWIRRTVKVPHPANKNYLLTKEVVERVLIPRRAAELRMIKKAMMEQAQDAARKSADRAFARIQPVEGEDDAPAETQAD